MRKFPPAYCSASRRPRAIAAGVRAYEASADRITATACRENAARFSAERFRREFCGLCRRPAGGIREPRTRPMKRSLLKDNAPLFEWLVRLFDPLLVMLDGLARVSLVSRHLDPARTLSARADRNGTFLLRAVPAAAPLFAAARCDAVRGGGPVGECLAADRGRLVRVSLSVEIGRGFFARMVAVLDRVRRGGALRAFAPPSASSCATCAAADTTSATS